MYHFVWIPKYRHTVFVETYREAMKVIIHKIEYDYDFDIQELETPEDHIHMVGYFVETIGSANEETISKYVQDQLIELDSKEMSAKQLGLF
jgi:putative transposase